MEALVQTWEGGDGCPLKQEGSPHTLHSPHSPHVLYLDNVIISDNSSKTVRPNHHIQLQDHSPLSATEWSCFTEDADVLHVRRHVMVGTM